MGCSGMRTAWFSGPCVLATGYTHGWIHVWGPKAYTHLGAVLRIPKTSPGFSDLLGLIEFGTYSCTHDQDPRERMLIKISKGKRRVGQSKRKPGPSFQSPLPEKPLRTYSIPPGTSCNNVCEMLATREAHWRLRAYGFHRGLVTVM